MTCIFVEVLQSNIVWIINIWSHISSIGIVVVPYSCDTVLLIFVLELALDLASEEKFFFLFANNNDI